VAYGPVNTEVVAYGRVISALPLEITAEVQGRVEAGGVPMQEGQRFRKGDLLFRIDHTERELALKAQKSTFMRDVAGILPDFKIDFPGSYAAWQAYFQAIDVERPLPELPKPASDQEKTYLATKNILSSFYTIKGQEASLAKHAVHAPFSGTIVQVLQQIGSYANPGTRVAKLLETDNLELKIALEAQDVRWIREGSWVDIATEDAAQSWKGRVMRIGQVMNPSTQSLDVFVRLQPGHAPVYEGMYLRTTIPGSQLERAMEVPRAALIDEAHVYTVQDSLLKVRPVVVHKLVGEKAVISGLRPGESLVVEPLMSAYEDMKVFRLADRKPASEAAKADVAGVQ
jgi:multidrug efflux pump subunit AcrA (membrane-fusion protein)